MSWSPGPVVTRRRLGGELKRLRQASGLLLEDVAVRLECSASKVSRLENGKGIPKVRDVRDMLDAYGVDDDEERARLLEWSRTGQQSMWWQGYADVLPSGLSTYLELEWDARVVQAYEAQVAHGLLQTRDYARAILETAWADTYDADRIDRLVEVRIERQAALARSHGLQLCCVLDESALYRVVGSPRILREQLRHMITVAEADHVELRILPFSAGLVVSASQGSFAKLEFGEGLENGVVFVERPGGENEFLGDAAGITRYGERFDALLRASLPEEDSMLLLARAHQRSTQ